MEQPTRQFNLRAPSRLLDAVRDAAKQNRRSATAEIITLVEEGLKWREQREKATA